MNEHLVNNRRRFLQTLGAATLGSNISRFANASVADSLSGFAYVGSIGHVDEDAIEVFRVKGRQWTRVQRHASNAPVCLRLHPDKAVLYAANRVAQHGGLPQGTVEAFSVSRETGALSLLQRQTLSLSGTQPTGLAISPDGRNLLVALYGGGAYNVLPLEENGTLGQISRPFKELGCSVHAEHQASAHPHSVLFDSSRGLALTSDLGCDRLSVFSLGHDGSLLRAHQLSMPSGAGPGALVLHPRNSVLYVKHELGAAISCHVYRSAQGVIDEAFQTIALPKGENDLSVSSEGLALHPDGQFLYASSNDGVRKFAIDNNSGALTSEQIPRPSQGGKCSYVLNRKTNCVLQMTANGRRREALEVASTSGTPAGLALLPC